MLKQVIAIRRDLKMGTGKIAGQACHACLGASENARKHNLNTWKKWIDEGAKKIVVKVYSLEEILSLEQEAKKLRIPNALVVDKGLTQIPTDTPTSIGIGPAENELVDRITGKLKLL